ncbi:hypothetical protein F441_20169 [Phytophthora nicotianae CJ01A1]|nr:hypothetical protein F444_20291 [Phytophthora nicotianae P1976]ETP02842.1 hypothetical protein F441_20169 [Phytophthora nicotianae CJ01A1]
MEASFDAILTNKMGAPPPITRRASTALQCNTRMRQTRAVSDINDV